MASGDARLRPGDIVRIRARDDGDWSTALVEMASEESPQAVALSLAGPVRAGHGIALGALALTIDYERETVTGLTGDEYEIDVACASR